MPLQATSRVPIKIGPAPLVQRLKSARSVLIATTNQPGLARGCQWRRELERVHELLRRTLPLDDILVCPHDETDHCPCRKPNPSLLIEAGFKWNLDLDGSFVISDKWQDAKAAWTVGCTSLLIQSPWLGTAHHDLVLPDLASTVERILQLQTAGWVGVA